MDRSGDRHRRWAASRGAHWPEKAASIAGLQPGVEDPDSVIESVRVADGDQGLSAAASPGAGKGLERSECELRLRERQPSLVAQPCVPARRGRLEAPRLQVERQKQQ